MTTTATIPDGIYFVHPDGSAWFAAIYRDGRIVSIVEESMASTHAAAGDRHDGIMPLDSDVEVPSDLAARIVRDVLGDDVDVTRCVVTRRCPTYTLLLRDEGGAEHRVYIVSPDDGEAIEEARDTVQDEAEDWCDGCNWPEEGYSATVYWRLTDEGGAELERGYVAVEIEPDHEALISAATRGVPCCGLSPDDHDWTSDGEGGCDENPGVWSTGGTSMSISDHCRRCGLHRTVHSTGSQRNPGDCDTVAYRMLGDDEIATHRANGDMD